LLLPFPAVLASQSGLHAKQKLVLLRGELITWFFGATGSLSFHEAQFSSPCIPSTSLQALHEDIQARRLVALWLSSIGSGKRERPLKGQ